MSAPTHATAPHSTTGAGTGSQFLTFRLGNEEYGLEILRVQEIKGCSRVTPLPNTPPEVRGVMNLRGAVVPIIDLRTRLGLCGADTPFTVVVLVTARTGVVGLVVDAVSDVLNFAPDEIVPPPDLGTGIDTTYLTGIARTSERLVALLDTDRLIRMTPTNSEGGTAA